MDLSPPAPGSYAVEDSRLKRVLTCGWNQTVVHLVREFPGGLTPESFTQATVALSEQAAEFPGVGNAGPFATKTDALLSSPNAIALAMHGELTHESYERLDDERILDVARRVTVEVDPAFTRLLDPALCHTPRRHRGLGDLRGRERGPRPQDGPTRSSRISKRSFDAAGKDPAQARLLTAAAVEALSSGDVAGLGRALAA